MGVRTHRPIVRANSRARYDFERKHGELVAAVPQGPNFLLRVVGPAFAAASLIALFIVAEKKIHGRFRRRRVVVIVCALPRIVFVSSIVLRFHVYWMFGLLEFLSSQLLLFSLNFC
jgi:uncharacterized membrane protein (GlpM family)